MEFGGTHNLWRQKGNHKVFSPNGGGGGGGKGSRRFLLKSAQNSSSCTFGLS